ncbi:PTS sugar transporter subunit IIA [Streptomyces sp. 8N706]|uniref:PTS sugar transporter subunit IIA n=1 Tax=Streptomyces sp. 8N706 TaxID=3457416 RepID=UPI003FD11268
MTRPADPPSAAGTSGQGLKLLAVTACPTGIAHTSMAAENLARAAESLGHRMKVETQGSTGAADVLLDNDVKPGRHHHRKTDGVTAPVVGFARSAEGIEWGSLDGTRATLIFMISVPEAAAGDEHLRILAPLSRKRTDTGFRERLTAAPDTVSTCGCSARSRRRTARLTGSRAGHGSPVTAH